VQSRSSNEHKNIACGFFGHCSSFHRSGSATAKDIYRAGWWGVRRGNLAVLAPKTSLSEALRFAIKYRLVCWGTFTYAGVDDVYVMAGGYSEF
jgi:hypothetical protein